MVLHRALPAIALSAAVGLVAVLTMEFIWGLYSIHHPINYWLIEHVLLQGYSRTYYTILYAHDVVVNVSLAYPFALLLALATPAAGQWKYIAVAVPVIFLWSYRLVLFGGNPLAFFTILPASTIGLAFTCGSLPLAYLLARQRRADAA